jgi:hypothetical protein
VVCPLTLLNISFLLLQFYLHFLFSLNQDPLPYKNEETAITSRNFDFVSVILTFRISSHTPLDAGVFLLRRPFEKFYYTESELCGGAVTVSFSKYLPWQAMLFLQRSAHFSKTCCRPLITSKYLTSELPFHGCKSQEIAWGETWTLPLRLP